MLEVDPQADPDATLCLRERPSPCETPTSTQILGTDYLRTLKKHYDALGSYLHTPTLAHIEQSKNHDYAKLALRCTQTVDSLEGALNSKVWNSTFSIRGVIEDQRVRVAPRQFCVACPQDDCGGEADILDRNVERGISWPCNGCGSQLTFALGVAITKRGGN